MYVAAGRLCIVKKRHGRYFLVIHLCGRRPLHEQADSYPTSRESRDTRWHPHSRAALVTIASVKM